MDVKQADAHLLQIIETEGPEAAKEFLYANAHKLQPEQIAFAQKMIRENSQQPKQMARGGRIEEEDAWTPSPVAVSRAKEVVQQQRQAPLAQPAGMPTKKSLAQKAAPLAADLAIGAAFGDPWSWERAARSGASLLFYDGGHVPGIHPEDMIHDGEFMSRHTPHVKGPLSAVKYKKEGGKLKEEYEYKYHNPLAGGSNA